MTALCWSCVNTHSNTRGKAMSTHGWSPIQILHYSVIFFPESKAVQPQALILRYKGTTQRKAICLEMMASFSRLFTCHSKASKKQTSKTGSRVCGNEGVIM